MTDKEKARMAQLETQNKMVRDDLQGVLKQLIELQQVVLLALGNCKPNE